MRQFNPPRFARTFLISAWALIASTLGASAVIVDTFEEPASPAPWIFSNGPEFPGATGSLTLGIGQSGYGAHLSFDITGGGNYVGATDWLPTPVVAGALQFWVKSPGGVRIQVRVNDSTGQTLQYTLNRPFEANNASQWYQLFVQLGATPDHWGGSVNDGVPHGAITGVTIMAQPGLLQVGAIDFDDVELVAARSSIIDPAGSVLAVPVVHNLAASAGVEITHDDATATGLNLVQTLGFHRIRTEMFWADVETEAHVYDFTWYDALVAGLKSRGLLAHFILCYGNPIYTNENWMQPPLTPAAIKGFANFAKAAAAHYAGQGITFEIWNEPDIAGFWTAPSASAYSALCEAAATQFHVGDPSAHVASGGLAGIDLAFLDAMIGDGALNNVNAVGVHPYRLEIPEGLTNDMADLRAQLSAAFPTNAPTVWSTEAGYSSAWYGDGTLAANRTTQAKYAVRQMLTALGLNVPLQIFFDLRDTGSNASDTEENFGIVDAGYKAKPLTSAVQTLLSQCKGSRVRCDASIAGDTSLHIFKFQNASDVLLVLWSESENGTTESISFPKNPQRALDYLGNAVAVTPDGAGNYSVAVGDAPVYVDFRLANLSSTASVKK